MHLPQKKRNVKKSSLPHEKSPAQVTVPFHAIAMASAMDGSKEFPVTQFYPHA